MVLNGLDILLQQTDRLKGRNIGLIANHTSVTLDLVSSWRRFMEEGVPLRRIFSPEHGLYGTEQDQIPVLNQLTDSVEVVSLYGDDKDSLRPPAGSCDDLDLILFDIQDVGARYYTFVNTMALFMESLQGLDLEFAVLDRPNPLGGREVEGPLLNEDFRSFVGIIPVPVRHGLTAGELALLYKVHLNLDIQLKVIRMQGWKRDMLFSDTGLMWVPPSPNMPTEKTSMVYPGVCLLEGTNFSEGRGTTTPFELVGADYVDMDELASAMNGLALPGVKFRPMGFTPTFHKHANKMLGGVYIHVTEARAFKPFLTGIALVKTAYDLYPGFFSFKTEVYEFEEDRLAFDLLTGDSVIQTAIKQSKDLSLIANGWLDDEAQFSQRAAQFHLY